MEAFIIGLPIWGLILVLVAAILMVSRGADLVVDQAVLVSEIWHMDKVVVGATVVSFGTTLPETAVSVAAAVSGEPGLALGNAVGSILCNIGLVLGIALLIRPIVLERKAMNRQSLLQLASAVVLVSLSLVFQPEGSRLVDGGRLTQGAGFVMVGLLVAYTWYSVVAARMGRVSQASSGASGAAATLHDEADPGPDGIPPTWRILVLLALGIVLVITGSRALVFAASEFALRIGVPPSVVAATLVAFGTSTPELVTAIAAARRGHGELALGNVLGANVLNSLFVAGLSAAVTAGGLLVQPTFYALLYPAMLLILTAFAVILSFSRTRLPRSLGLVLLASYVVVTVLGFAGSGLAAIG